MFYYFYHRNADRKPAVKFQNMQQLDLEIIACIPQLINFYNFHIRGLGKKEEAFNEYHNLLGHRQPKLLPENQVLLPSHFYSFSGTKTLGDVDSINVEKGHKYFDRFFCCIEYFLTDLCADEKFLQLVNLVYKENVQSKWTYKIEGLYKPSHQPLQGFINPFCELNLHRIWDKDLVCPRTSDFNPYLKPLFSEKIFNRRLHWANIKRCRKDQSYENHSSSQNILVELFKNLANWSYVNPTKEFIISDKYGALDPNDARKVIFYSERNFMRYKLNMLIMECFIRDHQCEYLFYENLITPTDQEAEVELTFYNVGITGDIKILQKETRQLSRSFPKDFKSNAKPIVWNSFGLPDRYAAEALQNLITPSPILDVADLNQQGWRMNFGTVTPGIIDSGSDQELSDNDSSIVGNNAKRIVKGHCNDFFTNIIVSYKNETQEVRDIFAKSFHRHSKEIVRKIKDNMAKEASVFKSNTYEKMPESRDEVDHALDKETGKNDNGKFLKPILRKQVVTFVDSVDHKNPEIQSVKNERDTVVDTDLLVIDH